MLDSQRKSIANIRAQQKTIEARKLKKADQTESEAMTVAIEDLIHYAGISV